MVTHGLHGQSCKTKLKHGAATVWPCHGRQSHAAVVQQCSTSVNIVVSLACGCGGGVAEVTRCGRGSVGTRVDTVTVLNVVFIRHVFARFILPIDQLLLFGQPLDVVVRSLCSHAFMQLAIVRHGRLTGVVHKHDGVHRLRAA